MFLPPTGVCYLASHLASLVRLDLSGCMSITTKSLEALQESLLYGGQNKTHFNLLVGGAFIQHTSLSSLREVSRWQKTQG